nr:protein Wnt-10a-like isoform X1 [Onthophagus taurus]
MLLSSPLCITLFVALLTCINGNYPEGKLRTRFVPFPDKTLCRVTPGLAKHQKDLCMKKPDVTKEAIFGIKMAYRECGQQFEGHRWNCTSLMSSTGNPYANAILRRGYKETAYINALASAGVVIAVSKACRQNDLLSCSCDAKLDSIDPKPNSNKKFKWKGCSDNLQFGMKFAKLFLDKRITGTDIFSHINLHNNHVGRLVVKNSVETVCKCHGVSGSCTMKACWTKAPSISKVGLELKKKYSQAIRIEQNNSGNGRKTNNKNKKNKKVKRRRFKEKHLIVKGRKKRELLNSLVFFETSPNFCDANPMLDFGGTAGRQCNLTASGPGNCSNLCCGRGYDKIVRKRNDAICKFVWCCNVTCVDNIIEEEVTVCK